jgi:hypothetical protein
MSATGPTWRRVADLSFQALDEETLVISPSRREVHLLSETAGRVWQLCASPRTLEEVVTELAEVYDASQNDLRRDVSALLDVLRDKNLVVSR